MKRAVKYAGAVLLVAVTACAIAAITYGAVATQAGLK